ncbi:hypothetical protein F441_05468 [Phytophthora nicotianae CJ01A1]|uniref:Uncharacterized protein n=1 Tax=Phytophthora nicotianae CJ01A1 TaxID=1317063 RepID=W2XG35_PHYNI|nr:hypothetical protein F441_05468 [Phytophthora nicotianae CJ01A1]
MSCRRSWCNLVCSLSRWLSSEKFYSYSVDSRRACCCPICPRCGAKASRTTWCLPVESWEFIDSTTGPSPASLIALYSVSTRLKTPAEYELTGDLVLGNTKHNEFALAERTLHLAAATVDATSSVQLATTDTAMLGLVQEHELARILGYPVALSECNEDAAMIEVGYFLEEGQERVLLTSYCAMATPQHKQRIQQHFQRYRSCSTGLQLTLQTSQI